MPSTATLDEDMRGQTVPMQAGRIHKGAHIMLRDQPCKVIEVTHIENGKHGAGKCHFTAKNIFSGDKLEGAFASKGTAQVPIIKKLQDLQVTSAADDGFVSFLDPLSFEIRSDLKLDVDSPLFLDLRRMLAEDREVGITVLSACGREQIVEAKAIKPG